MHATACAQAIIVDTARRGGYPGTVDSKCMGGIRSYVGIGNVVLNVGGY